MLPFLFDTVLFSWLTGSLVVGTLIALVLVTLWHMLRGRR